MAVDQKTIGLMQTLAFTQEDLAYNRNGQMSDAQRVTMQTKKEAAIATGQKASRGTPLIMLFYIVVLVVIIVAFLATGSFSYVQNALGQWTVPALAGVGFFVLIMVATIPMRYRRSVAQYSQEVGAMPLDFPVRSITGEIRLKTRSYGSNVDSPGTMYYYVLIIGGKEFRVSETRYRALKDIVEKRETYRLYYAEYGKTVFLLSAEASRS